MFELKHRDYSFNGFKPLFRGNNEYKHIVRIGKEDIFRIFY